MPNACNVPSRTIFTGDNLDILRGINSECVDLIYLDPPFNSNQSYAAPLNSEARGAEFDDVWTLSDMKQEWIEEVEYRRPALFYLINGAKLSHGESMAGYLTFMSIRLIEMHRILKTRGSIYLHCDPHASHYLKATMDALFGEQFYKAHITWRRTSAHNDSQSFGNVCDNILFYSSQPRINTRDIRVPLDEDYVSRFYRFEDHRGAYQLGDLTAAELRTGESSQIWRGYDPNRTGRHWAIPSIGNYAAWIDQTAIPGYRQIVSPLERLEALDQAGLIQYPDNEGMPRLKRYLAGNPGQVPSNLWTDIRPISNQSRERTGWRTQKPLALVERIINASSKENDLVLDPFCGCATACIAAEKLHREWIGIDILPQAVVTLENRAKRELQIPMADGNGRAWEDWSRSLRTEATPPGRTDLNLLSPVNPQTEREFLYAKQNGRCVGCQYELPLHVLTVDHIMPRSRGGLDSVGNLQLMCHTCNAIKGDRSMEYLRQQLSVRGILREGGS